MDLENQKNWQMAPTLLLTSYIAFDKSLNSSGFASSSVKAELYYLFSKILAELDSSQSGHSVYLNGQRKSSYNQILENGSGIINHQVSLLSKMIETIFYECHPCKTATKITEYKLLRK